MALQAQGYKDGVYDRPPDESEYDAPYVEETYDGWSSDEPDTLEIKRFEDPALLKEIRIAYAPKPNRDTLLANTYSLAGLKSDLSSTGGLSSLLALYAIGHSQYNPGIHLDAEILRLIEGHARKQSVVQILALEALVVADSVNAHRLVIDILQNGNLNVDERRQAVALLARTVPNATTIAFLAGLLQQAPSPILDIAQRAWAFEVLCKLHAKANLAERDVIEQHLLPYLQSSEVSEDTKMSALYAFGAHPSAATLSLLEEALKNSFLAMGDPDIEKNVVRMKGPAYVQALIDDDPDNQQGLWYIPYVWDKDPQRALQAMLQIDRQRPNGADHDRMLAIAWEIGGASLAQELIAALPEDVRERMNEALRLDYLPIDNRHPLRIYADSIFQTGVLRQPISNATLDLLRPQKQTYQEYNFAQQLLQSLACYTINRTSERYTRGNCGHFMNYLAPATQGKLDGLECYEPDYLWQETPGYLWLIFQGKAYRVTLRESYASSLNPIESLEVMDKILSDAGIPERFVPLPNYDEATYLFAEPAKAAQVFMILGFGE